MPLFLKHSSQFVHLDFINFNSQLALQQQTMLEKTFFGTIDYRNAKFQGSIRSGQPDGLALLFDHQHLLALSNFKKDTLNGPTLLIFPNRDYLYGSIKASKFESVCVYAKATGQTYVFNFANGQSPKIAYSDHNQIVIELFNRQGKLRMGETTSFKEKNANKWDKMSQILGIEVQDYMQNYKRYVQFVLQREFKGVVDCSEVSGFTFVGLKDTPSLGVKFNKDDKVQQVGYFEQFPRNIEFGRKYIDAISTKTRIQEGRFTEPERVFTYEQRRPAEAVKFSEEYFKRGTNFKNSFFKIPFYEEITKFLFKLQKQVNSLEFIQFGQKILEGQQDPLQQSEAGYKTKEQMIEEAKKEIYAAVKKRNAGPRRDSLPLQPSREKLRTSRENYDNYTPNKKAAQKYERPGQDKSLGKKKRFIYSEKMNQHPTSQPYVEMSEKRIQRLQYSPKFDYYPNSQKKLLSQFRNISPAHRAYYQDLYYQQISQQQPLLETTKRNLTPLRQRETKTRIHSPYEMLRQIRVPEREENLVTEPNHFTLGKNVANDESDRFNSYLKYKNRNKTPVKDSRSPLREQQKRKIDAQLSKGLLGDRRLLGNDFSNRAERQKMQDPKKRQKIQDPKKRQKIQDLAKREQILPARHKKHFKYV